MIRRSACRLGHHTIEAQFSQINGVDESVDYSDGIVFLDPVVQALEDQRRLAAVRTDHEAPHLDTPSCLSRILWRVAFSHSQGQKWE